MSGRKISCTPQIGIKRYLMRAGMTMETALDAWFRIAKRASWQSVMEVRKIFAKADAVKKWTASIIKARRRVPQLSA